MLEALIRRYLSTLEGDREILEQIQQHFPKPLPVETAFEAMEQSAQMLTHRWLSGEKGVRTAIARQLIPHYPQEALLPSLILDAMINILDDILDEDPETLPRALFILELLRLLSHLATLNLPPHLRSRLMTYYHKCTLIALSEPRLYNRIEQTADSQAQIEAALTSYLIRGTDADLFFEFPLLWEGEATALPDDLLTLIRVDRGLALLEKDWQDLEHDRQQGQRTPVTLLPCEGGTCLALLAPRLQAIAEATPDPAVEPFRTVAVNLRRHIRAGVERCVALSKGE